MTNVIDSRVQKYRDLDKGMIFLLKDHFYIKISDKNDVPYKSEAVDLQSGATFTFNMDEKVRTFANIEIHLS